SRLRDDAPRLVGGGCRSSAISGYRDRPKVEFQQGDGRDVTVEHVLQSVGDVRQMIGGERIGNQRQIACRDRLHLLVVAVLDHLLDGRRVDCRRGGRGRDGTRGGRRSGSWADGRGS